MPTSQDGVLPPPMYMGSQNHLHTLGGNKAFHNFYNDYSHISDVNLRRRLALSEIDKVPFGIYRKYTLSTARCRPARHKRKQNLRGATNSYAR